MPRQPRDRVRGRVESHGELLGRQPVDRCVHFFVHPPEAVDEYRRVVHAAKFDGCAGVPATIAFMTDEPGTMRAWRIHEYGRPQDVLRLDSVPIPEPDDGEVRVRVQAIPLNLNDLERITGGNMMVRPELPYSPGMEVMGVVDACGNGTSEWQGRRVVAMTRQAHGGFAEYAICPVVSAFAMPDAIPLPDAAALYFPFHLAWLGLFDRAELKKGESVLIQGASSGVGLMGLQIAKLKGARLVVGSSTNAGRRARLGEFGADLAIDSNDPGWPDQVLKATDGKGVDLIVDQISASVANGNLKACAIRGRIVNVGRLGGFKGEFDFDLHALKRIDYIGVTFRTRSVEEVREINRRMREDLWDAVEAGKLALPIDKTFPLDQAAAALAHMKANQHFGKIVLTV